MCPPQGCSRRDLQTLRQRGRRPPSARPGVQPERTRPGGPGATGGAGGQAGKGESHEQTHGITEMSNSGPFRDSNI